MKKLLLFYALFSNFVFAEGVAIHPATNFTNDLKYEGYYEFKEIKISNYYELEASIGLNINDDETENFLILLVPKSIIPPLSDDFDFNENKFYRRILVEVVSCEHGYCVGNTYFNLVSNAAGSGSGFNGMSTANDEIVIEHSKPNGNVYWSIQMNSFKAVCNIF